MVKFKIERAAAPLWTKTLIPIVAVLVTFLVTSILILIAKANPFAAYYHSVDRAAFLEVFAPRSPG